MGTHGRPGGGRGRGDAACTDAAGPRRYLSSSRALAVAASVALFWLTVSLIPVYNKHFFRKEFYPFPMATAGVQLGCVSVLLAAANSVHHFAIRRSSGPDDALLNKSWIFGPHFLWKIRAILPIGLLFGIKYGVTNLGLHLVPAPTHLLLQSTDLIWTILWAYFINGERASPLGMCCLCGCVAGSFVLSIQVGQRVEAPLLPIAINLLSPMILGLCVATLRSACVVLMDEKNRVGGTVSAVELTAIKLCISSAVALVLAMIFEGESDTAGESGWLDAFRALPISVKAGVIGGALPILIFQVNCTFLTHLTSSVAVGLVGQLKIIPQWIAATVFSSDIHFHLTGLNILGAALTMASAAAYAVNEYVIHSKTLQEHSDEDSDENKPLVLLRAMSCSSEASELVGMAALSTSPQYGAISPPDNTPDQITPLRV